MAKTSTIHSTNKLQACTWLVNLLERNQSMTRAKINEEWIKTSYSKGHPLDRKTFRNYLSAISDAFGVNIACDKYYYYSIVSRNFSGKMEKWLLKSFAATNALMESTAISNRILLEDIPSGQEYLQTILDAMKANKKISFEYQQFNEGGQQKIIGAEPYCVKLYHQRWYVLVKEHRTLLVSKKKIDEMHVYSLDRIDSLNVEDERFKLDEDFDAQEYFRYAFGTRVEKDNPPQKVLLKVKQGQCPYLRTLPLHHSQKEIETNDEHSIFELRVALTVELTMQILYYGSLVEVIEPQELRDMVGIHVYHMAEDYGIIEPLTEEEQADLIESVMDDPEFANKQFSQDVYNCEKMNY